MKTNVHEELQYYSDFKVNDEKFDDYFEAKAYKQKLLDADADVSVGFSGYDKRTKERVYFYIYAKDPVYISNLKEDAWIEL